MKTLRAYIQQMEKLAEKYGDQLPVCVRRKSGLLQYFYEIADKPKVVQPKTNPKVIVD